MLLHKQAMCSNFFLCRYYRKINLKQKNGAVLFKICVCVCLFLCVFTHGSDIYDSLLNKKKVQLFMKPRNFNNCYHKVSVNFVYFPLLLSKYNL